ncbi:MAG: ABC transporter permease [bacterium]|nr:ABC transporter permease [bacterium]
MFGDSFFFISEAFTSLKRSGIMIIISIATIAVSLIVFGVFLLLTANLNNIAEFVTSKLEIRVYLNNSMTVSEIQNFKTEIAEMPSVKSVEFISKDIAWDVFKKSFQKLELNDLVGINPLPDSFKVSMYNGREVKKVAKYLEDKFSGYVDDVGYTGHIAERIEMLAACAKYGGLGLVVFLTLATLFIIVNTIRLTVLARNDEIEIMLLVGATKYFIRGPFIIEGFIMGVTGGGAAVSFLYFFYLLFATKIQETIPFFPLVFDKDKLNSIYAVVLLLGAVLGTLGAYISVSKSLSYENMRIRK